MTMSSRTEIEKYFNANDYESFANKLVKELSRYLQGITEGGDYAVLMPQSPDEKLKLWSGNIPAKGEGAEKAMGLFHDMIAQFNHIHHPHSLGHQVPAPLPMAAVADHFIAFMNNSAAIYDMGPVEPIIETHLINWIAGLAGYSETAGGVFVSGGSLGNLTALLAARQRKIPGNVWKNGYVDLDKQPVVLVSEQAHYCVKRAVQIMGMGGEAAVPVQSDAQFRMDIDALRNTYDEMTGSGKQVFAVVANAGTTATGSFDPLDKIADFCEENNIWMHVDGAHGFAASLSENYRHLVAGIERADSFVWDLHKMMLMPSLLSAVVYRKNKDSYVAFAQKASYLFNGDDEEPWYDLAHRTLECTKVLNAVKAYVCLMAYGSDFFAGYVERCSAITVNLFELINARPHFVAAVRPDLNIACYRFEPDGMDADRINTLTLKIRERIVADGKFYIVQTNLNGKWYLRSACMNPITSADDLEQLLNEIERIGNELISEI